jgi:tetratricopeptide (TPR) repeat protein
MRPNLRRWLPRARNALAALVVLSAAGCSKSPGTGAGKTESGASSGTTASAASGVPPGTAGPAASIPSPAPSVVGKWPRTTSGEIAFGNLDATVRGAAAKAALHPEDAAASRQFVDLLLTRGQFRGWIADYERAAEVADAAVRAHPDSADAHLARASTLGTFHLFESSLQEVQAAADAKAPAPAVAHARATDLIAEGRFDEAQELGLWKDPAVLDSSALATAAVLAGERGQTDESEALFEKARAAFRDVTPFPVAWIAFQHGWLLERKGDRARAKEYFAQAHAALPAFAHAAVHLAAMDPPDEARAVLEPLLGHTDDPEVDAAYGDALRRLGRTDEAKTYVDRARVRYGELMAKHPEAFADHAAGFFLGIGQDPERAFEDASLNAAHRRTEAAFDLLITAALAAGKRDEACAAAAKAQSLAYATAAFRALVKTTRDGCAGAGSAKAP